MSRMTCFDPREALHDRRFRRKLTGWEFKDFLFLLFFAADECRDPAFVPARKVSDLAMELGMTGKDGRAKFAQRLAKWSAPGIELISLEADGGIQIDYVLDQDVEESEARDHAPASLDYALASLSASHSNGNGSHSNGNGNSSNYSVARRPRKNQSNTPGAEAKRHTYWQAKADTTGRVYVYDGITFVPAGHSENSEVSENFLENLRASESKPPVLTGELAEKEGQNLRAKTSQNTENSPEVSPVCVGDVTNVVRGFKESYSSGNVSNVPVSENLPKTSEQKPPARTSGAPGSSQNPGGRPPAPPPRPPLSPQQAPMARHADVREVIKAVGDDPAEWGAQWNALWKHCHEHNLLLCWDEGFTALLWRLRVSPPSGPGAIRSPSKWLRGSILALLLKAGQPYVPVAQSKAVPENLEPVDEAYAADVHRQTLELKAAWDAEEETLAQRITPLEDIQAETEDDDDN